jgi:hypothetical protein
MAQPDFGGSSVERFALLHLELAYHRSDRAATPGHGRHVKGQPLENEDEEDEESGSFRGDDRH